ncbi:MAG: DUF2489 domain-containing protein [Betaproteobacteria bacterium]|jgi:hypothetical protein
MDRMSHSQYIDSVRVEAARVAANALSGQVDLLVACIELSCLLARAELAPDDEDARVFMLIESEIDALPIGDVRRHWDAAALEQMQPDVDSATKWAAQIATPALKSVRDRFEP